VAPLVLKHDAHPVFGDKLKQLLAAADAVRAMALSFLRIEPDAVAFRRWPRREMRVPRRDIDRFDVVRKREDDGFTPVIWIGPLTWPKAPYDYLALLKKNGDSVRVPSKGSELAIVALRLNNELIRSP